MKNKMYCLAAVFAVVLVGYAVFLAGCEPAIGAKALTVEPAEANLLGGTNNTVTLTVTEGLRALSLPLKWWVTNPHLGEIAHSAGNRATYARTHEHGVNSIIVQDQYGAQGLASVRH